MIARLAFRNFVHRPWRSLLLLFGFGMGVGVMIVLLAIGEAMLTQARDERLVGGGDVTVLPEGLDIEVMKTGGVGGLFFSIDRSRFVYRQLLAAPRLSSLVAAVAPQVDGKLLYLRSNSGEYAVRAAGEIPSRGAMVGVAASLVDGAWSDDEGDRRYIDPTAAELRAEIDRFHLPPEEVKNRESWAEWHYFNVLSPNGRRWAFISFIISGEVSRGEWGGQVAITMREPGKRGKQGKQGEQGGSVAGGRRNELGEGVGEGKRGSGRTRRFTAAAPPSAVRFSTAHPNLEIGRSRVTLLPDGRYSLRARAREDASGAMLDLELVVSPAPHAYFPAASFAEGEFTSGYVVPAMRAEASGSLCIDGVCERYTGAQSYHDHNWGVWRNVTWEWGAARAGAFTVLYGRVHPPDSTGTVPPLVVYIVDSLGFLGIFRPREISYRDGRVIDVDGRTVRVPSTALLGDARGDDTLRMELEIEDAVATDTRRPLLERGDLTSSAELRTPYFIQMKGRARLSGRIAGQVLRGEGIGFFETYR